MNIDGTHVTCDFYGCKTDLNDKSALMSALVQAAEYAKSTVCSVHSHDFNPQGCSIVVILAESHETIHVFPESGEVSFDCFTCGNVADPELACEFMANYLKPDRFDKQCLKRGRR